MRSHGPPRGGDHIEPVVTETPTNRNLGSYHRRRHRIAVAPHRHQAVRSDLTDQSALGRIRHCGKWEQRFGIGKFAHCALSSPAGVAHRLAESIEAVLRLGQGVHHSGAPPTLAQMATAGGSAEVLWGWNSGQRSRTTDIAAFGSPSLLGLCGSDVLAGRRRSPPRSVWPPPRTKAGYGRCPQSTIVAIRTHPPPPGSAPEVSQHRVDALHQVSLVEA